MKDLLIPLMNEYQRLMEIESEFQKWKNDHPEVHEFIYKGQRVPRARFERIGVMIRQTMIDHERNHKTY